METNLDMQKFQHIRIGIIICVEPGVDLRWMLPMNILMH